METGDKCEITHFIFHLNIQYEEPSAKSSSLIKQSILCLCRAFIFQILPEKKVQKVIFPSRTSIPLYIVIEKKMTDYWVTDYVIPVYIILRLWLLQNLPLGIYCLHCSSFLWKPRNWYRNCFISRSSPDMDLTCCLLLQHTYHLFIYTLISFLPLM